MKGPQVATFLRMPPGDRGPRLRFLAERHLEEIASLDLERPDALTLKRHRRHSKALANIKRVAVLVGVKRLPGA